MRWYLLPQKKNKSAKRGLRSFELEKHPNHSFAHKTLSEIHTSKDIFSYYMLIPKIMEMYILEFRVVCTFLTLDNISLFRNNSHWLQLDLFLHNSLNLHLNLGWSILLDFPELIPCWYPVDTKNWIFHFSLPNIWFLNYLLSYCPTFYLLINSFILNTDQLISTKELLHIVQKFANWNSRWSVHIISN